jgi:hypothetical protein
MRTTRTALLAATAALALGGFAGIAQAQALQDHVLTLRLPDGQVEQIRYAGNGPPIVTLAPDAVSAAFDPGLSFAMLDQMVAAMDRQAEALFRTVNTMALPDAGAFGLIPAMSGSGVCTRSVQITVPGNGQAPGVVWHTSGDCGPINRQAAPATLTNPPEPRQAPRIVEAKAASPYRDLARAVSDWRR